YFFFQAEDGIRDPLVTGVQTCALPISLRRSGDFHPRFYVPARPDFDCGPVSEKSESREVRIPKLFRTYLRFGAKLCSAPALDRKIGRASCRERVEIYGGAVSLEQKRTG